MSAAPINLAPSPTTPHSLLPGAVRGAVLADVPQLLALMAPFVASGDLLPRSEYDLCRHIKEYLVVEAGEAIVGCGSLKIYSQELAELAALAVHEDCQGTGLGRVVVEALVAEARALGLQKVFALTRKPVFFLRVGFAEADKAEFPLKVWADCARCPRQACCDEVAVARQV
ncbi:MAG: N-acetyltransferase [Gemmatimonadetes bacterium]|nr:N-acetyltransferase [Gemmatimonadota bacterium]